MLLCSIHVIDNLICYLKYIQNNAKICEKKTYKYWQGGILNKLFYLEFSTADTFFLEQKQQINEQFQVNFFSSNLLIEH